MHPGRRYHQGQWRRQARAPQQFRKPQQHHQRRLNRAGKKHHAVRRRREYFPAVRWVRRGGAWLGKGVTVHDVQI